MADDTINHEVSEQPLTTWKNPPSVRELKQNLQDAKSDHDSNVVKIEGWLDNLNVTGKAKVDTPKGSSRIVPKLIRKQAEWRYSALTEPFLSSDDVFKVSPVSWEDKKAAEQNELVLNNQLNTKIDKVNFIDTYVRTLVDEGTAIVRVGWEFEEEEYDVQVPAHEFVFNPSIGPMHDHLAQLRQAAPEQYEANTPDLLKQAHELTLQHGQPVEARFSGYKTEKRTRTVKNQPSLEVCDFRNVYIDPTCQGDLKKAGFVIYSFESNLSTLKKDGRYKNLDKINISANSILGEPDHATEAGSQTFNFSDEPRKKFVVYEYWGSWDIDGTGRVRPIVAAWVGDTLIRMEDNPYPDQQIPFITVQYLPVRRSIYGEPDGALLEDNQKIIGAVTRGMIDIMGKSANGQTGIRKDMLDVTNKRKFDKGLDYEFNPNVDPRVGVFMHTYPEIPQSAQFMVQMQNLEAESLTGVKAFNQGISGQGLGSTAASVRGALDAASKRELGILRRLSKGLIEIGRKIIAMNAEFLSDVEVVRVTNEQYVDVRRDDLPGNFDLKLTISTAEADNEKAQELAFMLQTMGNNMDPLMSRMILADIARLRKMPDLAHRIETYQPQPDPLAQQKAQLELQLLQAQIEKERAQAQHLLAGSDLSGAKVGTEQAKAQHLKSDADLKNLDFVEQESGVKQERELQKQGEQARSNAQLKLLEHHLGKDRDKAKEQNKAKP